MNHEGHEEHEGVKKEQEIITKKTFPLQARADTCLRARLELPDITSRRFAGLFFVFFMPFVVVRFFLRQSAPIRG